MINRLHARWHRPERGWDPVPPAHAADYGAQEWARIDHALLDSLEARIGSLRDRRVLDLGGGPGHYSVAMARRGARVTWHDVSRTYLQMSQAKAAEAGVADRLTFSLGYLDEARSRLAEPFDLVFNRICWYYAFDDASFAGVVYDLVAPGGWAYVDTTNTSFQRSQLSTTARLRTWLNERSGIKIGHPMPPRGRLAALFLARPVRELHVDYTLDSNDRVLFQKAGTRP